MAPSTSDPRNMNLKKDIDLKKNPVRASAMDILNMVAMITCLIGLFMKMKLVSWIAVIMMVVYMANLRFTGEEISANLSLVLFCVMGLVMSYLNSRKPVAAPASA